MLAGCDKKEPVADKEEIAGESSADGEEAVKKPVTYREEVRKAAEKWLEAAKKGDIDYLISVTEPDGDIGREGYKRLLEKIDEKRLNLAVESVVTTEAEFIESIQKVFAEMGDSDRPGQNPEDELSRNYNRFKEEFGDQAVIVVLLDKSTSGSDQFFPPLVFRGTGPDLRFVHILK